MLYGWLPFPKATVVFQRDPQPSEPNPEEIETNVADKIDFIFMGSYKLEKEKFSFILDAVYLGMSSQSTSNILNTNYNVDLSLDAWLGALYIGYNLYNTNYLRFDILGGARYASLQNKISLDLSTQNKKFAGNINPFSADLFDAVIGFNGQGYLTKRWFIPYHFDIGTGSSTVTYKASIGSGYTFSWGDIILDYRYLYYDLSDSPLLYNIQFAGPLLGANFRF